MSRELKFKMIFDLAQKVTGPMQKISVGSRAMTDDLRKSRIELKALNQSQKQIDGFQKLKIGLRETGTAMDAANKKTAALARTIGQTDTPTRKMTVEFDRAKKESSALKDKFRSQQIELQQLRGSLSAAGISTGNLTADQRQLKTQIGKTNRDIDQQKSKLKSIGDEERKIASGRERMEATQAKAGQLAVGGAASIGAGFALGAPLILATQEAITFEAKMIDIKKVLNDVTPKQLIALEKGIIKMSGEMPIAAEGLGQIAAEGARAGIAAKELLPFTRNAAMMAAAFDITAEEAGSMMAKWRTGLGLTIPQTAILGDKVNALTNKFGGFAPAVTDMVTRIGPLGKIAGVAGGEMAAMAQLMNSAGVEAEIGATGIKRMMLTLNVGAAATNTQAAAFGRLGLDAQKMATTMQTDARGGILSVLDALNLLPKDQQAGVLTQLFGSESVASIAPLLSRLDRLKENFQLVGDKSKYAGSMNAEYAVAMSKTEKQIKTTNNALDSAQIMLGQQLIPALKTGAGYVKNMAIGFANWAGEHPQLVKFIGITVGIIAALLIVVGALAVGVAAVLGPFALLRFSFLMAGPQIAILSKALGFLRTTFMLVGRAFLLNPIGLAITAIAVGAYLIYSNWGKIVPWFQNLWANVKSAFSIAWEGIKSLFLNYTPLGLIYQHWDSITAYFGTLWTNVKSAFSTGWTNIKSMAASFSLADIGKNIIIGLASAITGGAGRVWNALKGVVMGGVGKVKSLLGIKSPSRVFMGIGGHVGDGMAIGIDDKGKRTKEAMKRMALGLTAAAAISTPSFAAPTVAAPVINAPRIFEQAETLADRSSSGRSPQRTDGGTSGAGSNDARAASHTYNFNITQNAGEDSEALAERIMEMLERKKRDNSRSDYEDDF